MATPKRIQRKRTKGWTAPDGVVYVGRGSMWGNPFTVKAIMDGFPISVGLSQGEAQARAVKMFEQWLERPLVEMERRNRVLNQMESLRGKDLMCWCGEGPCHADVLLKLANKEAA